MKKLIPMLVMIVLFAAISCGCSILNSAFYAKFPSGFTDKEEHFDPDGFQDSVDYCKYFYPSAEAFENDDRFESVGTVGAEKVKSYFDDFADWMDTCGRLDEYDFDPATISDDDFVCIKSEPHFTDYDDYDVYYFDVRTLTLYYIHANI